MQAKCILKCCQIVDLVKILKSKEDPWDMFRFLLKDICTTFPAQDSSQDGTFVRVSCPWEEASAVSVSPDGFVLLEAAEGAMESTEQVLEVVQVDVLRFHLLSDVGSRVARQQDKNVNSRVVVRSEIVVHSEERALALSLLLQHCKMVEIGQTVEVAGNIRREGWASLRESFSRRLHDIPHLDTGSKNHMASARREDLRAIWECLSLSWRFTGDHEVFDKQRGEDGWRALEQFLDLTNEEWRAAKRTMQQPTWQKKCKSQKFQSRCRRLYK